MRTVLRPLAGFCLLWSCAHTVNATDLSEVLADALKSDPKIGAARAGYLSRAEIVPQARSGLLPQITATGSTEDDKRTGVSTSFFRQHGFQGELRQPLVAVEKYYSLRSAQAQRDSARFELTNSEQNLLLRVADAYFNVLRAQDQLETATAEEAAVKRQLEQVQQRFDVGLVAITDVLDSQAVYDNAVVKRIQADGNHDIFFETLRTLTGKSYDDLAKLSPKLPVVYPEPRDEEVWVNQAMASNALIKSAEETLLASQRDVTARRAAGLPTVDAVATYSEFRTTSVASFGNSDNRVYQLQARLPIMQGGFIHSRVQEAKYRTDQSAQLLEDQRRTVGRDTRNLFRTVITDVARVRAGEKSIQSSKAALDATQTGYEVGTRNIVDVLQAQQRLYESTFAYADSRYAYITDLLRLKQAAGALAQQDLTELNAFLSPADTVKKLPIGRLYQEGESTMAPGTAPPQATGPLAAPKPAAKGSP